MNTTGSTPKGPERPPSTNSTVDIKAQGPAVLLSLINFIRPISNVSNHSNLNIDHLCNSVQGQEYLKALGNFVDLVVHSGEDPNVVQRREDPTDGGNSVEQFIEARPNALLPMDAISDVDEFCLLCNLVDLGPVYDLQTSGYLIKVIESLNKHIFNKMPIRMISFDSNGEHCTLIERGKLAGLVISRIQDTYATDAKFRRRLKISADTVVADFCKYAILSHTWMQGSPGEIVFQEWENRTLNTRGNEKITNFCEVAAREHGVLLGWVDNVCINKESSTELDESIRSMYKWYQEAHVCIAYLGDTVEFEHIPKDRWFTRGWTLQELLANSTIHFYNTTWTMLLPGDFTVNLMDDPTFSSNSDDIIFETIPVEMQYQIFKATTITQSELKTFYNRSHKIPMCRTMELAAQRTVTRAEDQIYSLMGLLGVGISIAYGEGPENALRRIIKERMNSYGQFLDLFNHTNGYSILPYKVHDYIGHPRTVKNAIAPHEPLTLSHVGVHAKLLAIPMFRKYVYGKEELPFNVTMVSSSSDDYFVLDNSSSAAEWITTLEIDLSPRSNASHLANSSFVFLVILSSRIDEQHDRFQISVGDSLGIQVLPDILNPSDNIVTKRFLDIKPLSASAYGAVGWQCGPVHVNLPFSGPNTSKGVLTLTGPEIKQLGFRVIYDHFF